VRFPGQDGGGEDQRPARHLGGCDVLAERESRSKDGEDRNQRQEQCKHSGGHALERMQVQPHRRAVLKHT
jgi:hypothetical protein